MVNEGYRHGRSGSALRMHATDHEGVVLGIKPILVYELSHRILCRIATMLSYELERSTFVLW